MSPFVGWFLLVSAYTKRSPLLMAFMPLVLIRLLEGLFSGRTILQKTCSLGDDWRCSIFGVDIENFFDEDQWRIADGDQLLAHLDIVQILDKSGYVGRCSGLRAIDVRRHLRSSLPRRELSY